MCVSRNVKSDEMQQAERLEKWRGRGKGYVSWKLRCWTDDMRKEARATEPTTKNIVTMPVHVLVAFTSQRTPEAHSPRQHLMFECVP